MTADVAALETAIDAVAAEGSFSGVVRVDVGDELVFERAYGFADRRFAVPNRIDTQFGVASGMKSITALMVMSLVESGTLTLATRARELLGTDLPLVDDDVTIEQLLSHRSGIGDYLDEDELGDDVADFVMTLPVHVLTTPEAYLPMLDGLPQRSAPGSEFRYNNGAFVVLAIIATRAAGVPFADLVARRVLEPAGLADTAFLPSNELPARAATGYLRADGLLTNVLHLPIVGGGDGGIYTTVADVQRLWVALFGGGIVSPESVATMVEPRSTLRPGGPRYGLGFWLAASGPGVQMEGMDAGVSFRSTFDPVRRVGATVLSNTTDGAWPVARVLAEALVP